MVKTPSPMAVSKSIIERIGNCGVSAREAAAALSKLSRAAGSSAKKRFPTLQEAADGLVSKSKGAEKVRTFWHSVR